MSYLSSVSPTTIKRRRSVFAQYGQFCFYITNVLYIACMAMANNSPGILFVGPNFDPVNSIMSKAERFRVAARVPDTYAGLVKVGKATCGSLQLHARSSPDATKASQQRTAVQLLSRSRNSAACV